MSGRQTYKDNEITIFHIDNPPYKVIVLGDAEVGKTSPYKHGVNFYDASVVWENLWNIAGDPSSGLKDVDMNGKVPVEGVIWFDQVFSS